MAPQKIGLALGGGAAKGLAHIGVLKVLVNAGYSFHCIAGTSIGSLIGAFYASGMDLKSMEQLACNLDRTTWIDLNIPTLGIFEGSKLEQLVSLLTKKKTFEQLLIPLSVVAADLYTGEKIVINTGKVAPAVRASCSIPGIFRPVKWEERLLIDGGVVDRVPASVAREMGADFVLAVDPGIYLQNQKINHIMDVITQSIDIMSRELSYYRTQSADFIISPDLESVAASQFNLAAKAIAIGAEAAEKALQPFKKMLGEK